MDNINLSYLGKIKNNVLIKTFILIFIIIIIFLFLIFSIYNKKPLEILITENNLIEEDYIKIIELNNFEGEIEIYNKISNDNIDIDLKIIGNNNIIETENLSIGHIFSTELKKGDYIVFAKKT